MTVKGTLAAAVVLLAIWLFVRGQTPPAPVRHPAVHTTAPHAHATKGKR